MGSVPLYVAIIKYKLQADHSRVSGPIGAQYPPPLSAGQGGLNKLPAHFLLQKGQPV